MGGGVIEGDFRYIIAVVMVAQVIKSETMYILVAKESERRELILMVPEIQEQSTETYFSLLCYCNNKIHKIIYKNHCKSITKNKELFKQVISILTIFISKIQVVISKILKVGYKLREKIALCS